MSELTCRQQGGIYIAYISKTFHGHNISMCNILSQRLRTCQRRSLLRNHTCRLVWTHTGPIVQGVFGPLWPAGSSSADEARVCIVFNCCVSAGRLTCSVTSRLRKSLMNTQNSSAAGDMSACHHESRRSPDRFTIKIRTLLIPNEITVPESVHSKQHV